jgi:glucose-1-phosphate thymidylyltransferase
MKGIILAGGTGSRLFPLTKVTNKHLLPVYDKPMIYYPLHTLINAGITEIMIVSGRGHAGHFLELLGSGMEFGVSLTYEIQETAGGIAQALGLAASWADDVISIEEKPPFPKSNFAVTGLYLYDNEVFSIIRTLKPSGRGELEITDVNNAYIQKEMMQYAILKGFWSDAGTFDSLLRASILVQKHSESAQSDNQILKK